jgi:hypothetical protein
MKIICNAVIKYERVIIWAKLMNQIKWLIIIECIKKKFSKKIIFNKIRVKMKCETWLKIVVILRIKIDIELHNS